MFDRAVMAAASTLGVAIALLALPGCGKNERALRCQDDAAAVRELIVADQRTGSALHDVDAVAGQGNPAEAAKKLERDVLPAATHAKELASSFQPRSRWGVARKQELAALVQDREALAKDYGDALRSEVIQKVVLQMERQMKLERRALDVEKSARSVPTASSDLCDAP